MSGLNISIKEISDEYKTFLNSYFKLFKDDLEERLFETKEELTDSLEEWFNSVYDEENFYWVLENTTIGFIEAEKEKLAKIIEKYYKASCDMYCYYEFEYTRYGANLDYFYPFNPLWLYLCALYYEHTNNEKFAVNSYYFCLITICKSLDLFLGLNDCDESEDIIKLLDLFEPKLESIKNTLFPDWLTINPNLTFAIGNYYLRKRNYEMAVEYFELGSSFDYDGRQSIEPFLLVAKNKYELGVLYLKGLGVRQDTYYAIELFEDVAYESGSDYLPIMGDIYYEGIGVEKDYDMALRCYCAENKSCYYLHYYKLDDAQLIKIDKILQYKLENENLSKDELSNIVDIYSFVLNNSEKADELYEKIFND